MKRRYEDVQSQVKLVPVKQERIRNVLLNDHVVAVRHLVRQAKKEGLTAEMNRSLADIRRLIPETNH
jgi:hypothetical protein